MKTLITNRLARFTAGVAFSVAAVALSGTAFAAPSAPSAPSVKVTYTDLNLHNSADAQRLYRRLSSAADQVCGSVDHLNLSAVARWQNCYRAALERAVMDVKSPELLAIYRDKLAHGVLFS